MNLYIAILELVLVEVKENLENHREKDVIVCTIFCIIVLPSAKLETAKHVFSIIFCA